MANRRSKSSAQKNGSSPLGYTLFGIVIGLGIAAAGAYYLRSQNPSPTNALHSSSISTSSPVSEQAGMVSNGVNSPGGVHSQEIQGESQGARPLVQDEVSQRGTNSVEVENRAQVNANKNQLVSESNAPREEKTQTSKSQPSFGNAMVKPSIETKGNGGSSAKKEDQIGNLIHHINDGERDKKGTSMTISPTYLQVGAFKNYEEANAKRAQLLMHGFDNISMTQTRVNNIDYVRVRIGPFSTTETLKEAQTKLKEQNIKASIIR